MNARSESVSRGFPLLLSAFALSSAGLCCWSLRSLEKCHLPYGANRIFLLWRDELRLILGVGAASFRRMLSPEERMAFEEKLERGEVGGLGISEEVG